VVPFSSVVASVRSTRACFAATLFAFASGCGQILGLDGYSVAEPAPDTRLPLLPAHPDPDRVKKCEDCAQTSCKDQRDACLASEPCRELLSCHGRCSDPSCIVRCRDAHTESFLFDDYLACVFDAAYSVPGGQPSLCGGSVAPDHVFNEKTSS
jgi:hypothetical protein